MRTISQELDGITYYFHIQNNKKKKLYEKNEKGTTFMTY